MDQLEKYREELMACNEKILWVVGADMDFPHGLL